MKLNKLITTIEIEMSGETKRYLVSAKQGDKATRFIRAKLKNMGGKYLIPDGANAIVNITKPDNKHVYNTCDYEENEVFIELTSQILAVSGTAFCDIEIRNENNEQVITSVTFEIEIEKEIRNENALESSNEFTELERMGALSKSYAVGGTGSRAGEDTDNAKYYKGEAQEARDKAAASAAGAGTSAETAVKSAKESKSYAVGGTGSRTGEDTDNAKYYKGEAQEARDKAAASAAGAEESAETAVKIAKESQSYAVGGTGSRAGEDTDNARYYKGQAQDARDKAAKSESNALITATNAKTSETNAKASETNAKKSETNAKESETKANTKALAANTAAISAGESAEKSNEKATAAENSAKKSQSYAVGETGSRAGENTDNAKYYSEQAKKAVEGIGNPVTGVKGDAEKTYRKGDVNLTKANIGLENVNNTSDENKPVSIEQKKAIDEVKRLIEYHEIVAASGSVLGHVELTNSVASSSTTTAAVPASVKAAYDLASSAVNNINAHKKSTDHDGRYYTESEINNLIGNINNRILDQNTESSYDLIMRRSTTNHGRNNSSYWFIKNGIFETTPQTEGAANWGTILVIKPYNDWVFQIWFVTDGHIYTRRNINGGGFTGWQTII